MIEFKGLLLYLWHCGIFLLAISLPMGFLKDLISGHEAFFAASDVEKGWAASSEEVVGDAEEEQDKAS